MNLTRLSIYSSCRSTYLGSTTDTSFTVDLSTLTGTYDGFIVKSAYAKFKSNASDGIKLLFLVNPQINESDFTVSISPLEETLTVGSTYTPLTTSSISSIKFSGTEVLNDVTNLNVHLSSISNSLSTPVDALSMTSTADTYKVKYEVSFKYSNKTISKTYTQTVKVN